MNARELDAAFRDFLRQHGVDLEASPPSVGVQAVLRFYREVRADGCDPNLDTDMLLYQWGTYDWGHGERFELDLTRQVILPNDEADDALWQLHVTYRYMPTAALRELGAGNRWSSESGSLDEFVDLVTSTDVYAALADRRADAVSVEFECAG